VLAPYRVLDLTDERGLLCGQILADLGADVIQIEPRAGSSARRIGPWRGGVPGPERSLFWAAYTRNKRGLALDLDDETDRRELRRLVAGADFLIESERPGRLADLDLGYEALSRIQPGLVYVSITAFGQDGPKAHWAATDLTLMAAGGFAYLSGDADGPPTRVRVPQAHVQAAADAAVGALMDEAVGMAPAQRLAGGLQVGGVLVPIRHATRDGWVTLGPSILPSTGHFMKRLLAWVTEEGGSCDPAWLAEDWGTFGIRLGARQLPADAYDPVKRCLDRFFATRTNAELMRAAVERGLLLAPVLGLHELVESEQLTERRFRVAVGRSDGPVDRFPGPFAKFDASPIRYRWPPPRLDEHGATLRGETARRPAPTGREEPGALPLSNVKILDLFWVIAGPSATRMLADYGATVVRVESTRVLDTLRVSPPWQFGQPHPEGAAGFQSANANKLGVTLDLTRASGRDVALDLVRWADVVTESFAPGVMDSLGLGWEQLRSVKPDLIMLSSCIMGQSGPWRDFKGFGRLAVSLAGFQQLASWPGRPPSGPFGAYTDAIAARYNALALLAALEHRSRTGEGQYVDLSQTEAALHFLAPAFLDWTVNRRAWSPAGNDDPDCCPHGMFRTAGEDRWVAIAVRDGRDWQALCEVIGRPDLRDGRDRRSELEEAVDAWTRARDASTVEALLQEAGVPAHAALDMPGLYADPQLRGRGHFIEIAHEIYPRTTIESSRLRLSRTPARTPARALSLGRDNHYVLETLLGYSRQRIADLEASGTLT
jgi:crotonobetainyl-CoA:carnitine CoA-transferase CaiB-like acyl-CoA transferase